MTRVLDVSFSWSGCTSYFQCLALWLGFNNLFLIELKDGAFLWLQIIIG